MEIWRREFTLWCWNFQELSIYSSPKCWYLIAGPWHLPLPWQPHNHTQVWPASLTCKFSFMQVKIIFTTKLLLRDSFWNRGRRQMGYWKISIQLFRERLSRLQHFRTFWENDTRRHRIMSRAIYMTSRLVISSTISLVRDVMLRHNKNNAFF